MQLRVRFAETDQMGIAHHSAYVLWIEVARVEWLRERGMFYREMERSGLSLAVSSLQLDYRRSAGFDDCIRIDTKMVEAKSRRVRYRYWLYLQPDDAPECLLASAETMHTPVDRSGRAIRLPPEWLERLQAHIES